MFKDKIRPRMQDIAGENLVRNGSEIIQSVWGVGKNQVEFLMTDGQEIKHIMADDSQIVKTE